MILDEGEASFGIDALDDLVLGAGRALFDVTGEEVGRRDDAVEQAAALNLGAERAKHAWQQNFAIGELGDLVANPAGLLEGDVYR